MAVARPSWRSEYGPHIEQVFPQLAVYTGGCSPNQPWQANEITNGSIPPRRTLAPFYKN